VAQGSSFVDVSAACVSPARYDCAVPSDSCQPIADRLHDTDVIAMRADWNPARPHHHGLPSSLLALWGPALFVPTAGGHSTREALPEFLSAFLPLCGPSSHAAAIAVQFGTGVVAVRRPQERGKPNEGAPASRLSRRRRSREVAVIVLLARTAAASAHRAAAEVVLNARKAFQVWRGHVHSRARLKHDAGPVLCRQFLAAVRYLNWLDLLLPPASRPATGSWRR